MRIPQEVFMTKTRTRDSAMKGRGKTFCPRGGKKLATGKLLLGSNE